MSVQATQARPVDWSMAMQDFPDKKFAYDLFKTIQPQSDPSDITGNLKERVQLIKRTTLDRIIDGILNGLSWFLMILGGVMGVAVAAAFFFVVIMYCLPFPPAALIALLLALVVALIPCSIGLGGAAIGLQLERQQEERDKEKQHILEDSQRAAQFLQMNYDPLRTGVRTEVQAFGRQIDHASAAPARAVSKERLIKLMEVLHVLDNMESRMLEQLSLA